MPQVKLVFDEEELKNNRRPVVGAGWYYVEVVDDLEIGKVNFKYFLWKTFILEADEPDNQQFVECPFEFRTIIEKGDDPKKSKRWLFHMAMRTLEIKKDGKSYVLTVNDDKTKVLDIKGSKFWVLVTVKPAEGNFPPKNEVKHINNEPKYWSEPAENHEPVFPDPEEGKISF